MNEISTMVSADDPAKFNRNYKQNSVSADLHGAIFVACDKLTTGPRHDLRLSCTSQKIVVAF